MLTGEMLTGQMLTRVFSYDLILARQIYLDKTGLLIFILFILGFLSPPSPALLTYGGISFAQLGGFGVFLCTITTSTVDLLVFYY